MGGESLPPSAVAEGPSRDKDTVTQPYDLQLHVKV